MPRTRFRFQSTFLMEEKPIPKSFPEFWQLYLNEHQSNSNRWLHVIGTVASIAVLVYCLVAQVYWAVVFVPVVGYGFAWFGHAFIEKNRPLSLRAPVWSLLCDYRMALLMLCGRSSHLSGSAKSEKVF